MAQAAWIWWLSGGVLAAAGLALLWWSLFRDRARGRRRCPRCWYDMAVVPGLVCPECGRDARREKRLFKTRPRWRRAGLGVVLIVIAAGFAAYPVYSSQSPYAFLPTEVLVLMAPEAGREAAASSQAKAVRAELEQRIDNQALSARQWSMLVRGTGIVYARPRWPRGRRLLVDVTAPCWLSTSPPAIVMFSPNGGGYVVPGSLLGEERELRFYDADGLPPLTRSRTIGSDRYSGGVTPEPVRIDLGTPSGDRAVVRLDIEAHSGEAIPGVAGATPTPPQLLWSGIAATVQLVDDPLEVVTPCDRATSDAMTKFVRCTLRVRNPQRLPGLGSPRAEVGVQFEGLDALAAATVAVGLRAELLRDGEVVATGEMLLTPGPVTFFVGPHERGELLASMTRLEGFEQAIGDGLSPEELDLWELRIRGDPLIAVDDIRKAKYWQGEVTRPLAVVYEVVKPAGTEEPDAVPQGGDQVWPTSDR